MHESKKSRANALFRECYARKCLRSKWDCTRLRNSAFSQPCKRDAAMRRITQQLVGARQPIRFVNFDNVFHSLFKLLIPLGTSWSMKRRSISARRIRREGYDKSRFTCCYRITCVGRRRMFTIRADGLIARKDV